MTLIVITTPQFFKGEAAAVTSLFRNGLEILHLRKPESSAEEIDSFLRQLPVEYMSRIVTHEQFQLTSVFGLKGIHLNGRNPQMPAGYTGHVSCSCHSLEEVLKHKSDCNYVFLSPIYDSISKEGYSSAYSSDTLKKAQQAGIIDSKVMALGGISLEHLQEITSLGFGGAALLGDIWQQTEEDFLPHFLHLKQFFCPPDCPPLIFNFPMLPPTILSIAGSDCSGGAGIQADIKAISALGSYAASVITAVTAQNTLGVQSVYPIPADMVRAQIISVMDDLQPDAVKIGMVHDAGIVTVIAGCLKKYCPKFVVYDPVMVSTSGRCLMTEETIRAIKVELFPLCTLVTPNLSEASLLWGQVITDTVEMQQAARELSGRYNTAVLIKGGHLEGNNMCDVLYYQQPSAGADDLPSGCILYSTPKIESRNLHGTGCTLSSAIATFLAGGSKLDEAVRKAKEYISTAINQGKDMNIGHGNGPLWHFPLSE